MGNKLNNGRTNDHHEWNVVIITLLFCLHRFHCREGWLGLLYRVYSPPLLLLVLRCVLPPPWLPPLFDVFTMKGNEYSLRTQMPCPTLELHIPTGGWTIKSYGLRTCHVHILCTPWPLSLKCVATVSHCHVNPSTETKPWSEWWWFRYFVQIRLTVTDGCTQI